MGNSFDGKIGTLLESHKHLKTLDVGKHRHKRP